MPDNSLEIKYEINNAAATSSNVKLSNLLDPPSNAVVSDSLGNLLAAGSHTTSPVSGNEFSIAGSLANATVEFNDSLGFDSPTGLTIDVPASGQPQIRFDWDLTLGAGQSMTIGFKYGSFSLNMDVYERTREVEITQHIETTTVTDIRDIDFEPPKIPIQAGETEQDVIKVPVFDADAAGLHLTNIGVMPPANPRQSLSKVDTALTTITSYRSIYGAFQNRLEHTFNNVGNYAENLTASESRIRDADMAKEMVDYSKNNILLQATQSLLAQANSTPQGVLGLLK